jgi:hypothetical protein
MAGPSSSRSIATTPPPGEGGQGCTPGYWKNHTDSWPAPYTPGMLFSATGLDDAFPGMTLLQVLEQGGGGVKALGRHTVAALLSATSPNVSYDVAPADIFALFNTYFPNDDLELLKNYFATFNEQGCPLN